jgi:hypothetical protein
MRTLPIERYSMPVNSSPCCTHNEAGVELCRALSHLTHCGRVAFSSTLTAPSALIVDSFLVVVDELSEE